MCLRQQVRNHILLKFIERKPLLTVQKRIRIKNYLYLDQLFSAVEKRSIKVVSNIV